MSKHFHEVTDPADMEQWKLATGLGIQLADYEPEEAVFLAAHGNTNSFLLARVGGEEMAWAVTEGTKEERQALAQKIRDVLPT